MPSSKISSDHPKSLTQVNHFNNTLPDPARPDSEPPATSCGLPFKDGAIDSSYSYLLSLPLELKLEITGYLVHGPQPSLAILRRVHTHFRDIIPKDQCRAQLSITDARAQLLEAEHWNINRGKHPGLVATFVGLFYADYFLPCYECIKVLEPARFSRTQRYSKPRGSDKAHKRLCLDCALKKGIYQTRTPSGINGIPGRVCTGCGWRVAADGTDHVCKALPDRE